VRETIERRMKVGWTEAATLAAVKRRIDQMRADGELSVYQARWLKTGKP
jgi:hypothetical protein